jgi:hypothetical protein
MAICQGPKGVLEKMKRGLKNTFPLTFELWMSHLPYHKLYQTQA